MAKVEIENLTRYFGVVAALDELNIEVKDGEFISILGPSGCGKSTTLNMLAGLLEPTSGDIRIDGKSVVGVAPGKRGIGLIFQDYSIFPQMSPMENLEFGLRVRGTPKEERRREAARVCSIVELEESTLRRPTEKLTPGELQRLAIARTLVTKPEIVLLDEPLSNLEPDLRARTRAKLKRLFADLNQTTIYVTHDQVEAMSLSDRILVLNHGRLQQFGTAEEIYARSANTFVGGFLGGPPMNFLRGELFETDGRLEVRGEGFNLDLTTRRSELIDGDREVIVGVRPESLYLRAPEDGGLRGQVFAIEPLGSETIVDVDIAGTVIKVLDEPRSRLAMDDSIGLEVSPDYVHIFDGISERSRLSAVGW